MADAGVRTHGEAVLGFVGLLDLLGVEGDVEGFEGLEVDGGEFGGDGCGEHSLAELGGEVVEGGVVGAVDHFVGTGGLLVNVKCGVCWVWDLQRCAVFDAECGSGDYHCSAVLSGCSDQMLEKLDGLLVRANDGNVEWLVRVVDSLDQLRRFAHWQNIRGKLGRSQRLW